MRGRRSPGRRAVLTVVTPDGEPDETDDPRPRPDPLRHGRAGAAPLATTQMSCPQARGLVARSGGIVLGTSGQTYDRFVSDRSFCEATEATKAAYAPTRTDPACFVGYTCFEPGARDSVGDY